MALLPKAWQQPRAAVENVHVPVWAAGAPSSRSSDSDSGGSGNETGHLQAQCGCCCVNA
jgi:hypothetical protein